MSEPPRLLVFQHLDVEHPGIFRDFLAVDGIPWDPIELDAGETIPDLDRYAGLWVMGGPMDVWQVDEHPWLGSELAAIRHAVVDLQLPFLGICLGHQLLAAALGGAVAQGVAEVGVMPVELTDAGRDSAYFAGLPSTLTTLQWHGAEVTAPPPGARVLARSAHCAVQALAIANHAVSAQFHVEVTADTVAEWGAIPAYAEALDGALGAGALPRFQREVELALAEFSGNAKRFYENWMRVSGFPRSAHCQ
jgi:GMP synthase-like glutamine amidotransferase